MSIKNDVAFYQILDGPTIDELFASLKACYSDKPCSVRFVVTNDDGKRYGIFASIIGMEHAEKDSCLYELKCQYGLSEDDFQSCMAEIQFDVSRRVGLLVQNVR